MRILLVDGGPRKAGTTSGLLTRLMERLKDSNEIVLFRAYDKEIKPCIGCLRCRPDKECVLPRDGGHEFAQLVREADAVLVGSPTYWGNMTGKLKLLFERCVPVFEYIDGTRIEKRLRGKRAAILVTSAAPFPLNHLGCQAKGAARAIGIILRAGGFRIRSIVNIPNNGNIGSPAIERMLGKLARAIT